MFKEKTVIARDSANVGGDVDEAKRSDTSAIEEMHDYTVKGDAHQSGHHRPLHLEPPQNSTGTCILPYKLQQTHNHPFPNCCCSFCYSKKTNSNPDREDLATLANGKIADDASSLSEVVYDSSVQRSEGVQTLHRNVKYVNTCHRPGFDVELSVSHADGEHSLPSHPQQSSGIVFVNDIDADCWEDYSFGDDDDNYCFTSSQLIRFENDKECQDV
jgi:hypothetical protein